MAVNPVERDAIAGPRLLEIVARVAAQTGEFDRAIAALQKWLSSAQRSCRSQHAIHSRMLRLDQVRSAPD